MPWRLVSKAHCVLDGDRNVAAGQMQLGTLRDSYDDWMVAPVRFSPR
jgi:hypothetical protein